MAEQEEHRQQYRQTASQELARAPAPAPARPRGIQVSSMEELWRFAQALAKAPDLRPRTLDTPEKCFIAMQTGMEAGLSPMQAVRAIYVTGGIAQWYAKSAMALVRRSGLLRPGTGIESWIEVDGERVDAVPFAQLSDWEGHKVVAKTRTWRVDEAETQITSFSVEQAKTARLWGKTGSGGSPSGWVTYPDRMLIARSRSLHLADQFPEVLLGIDVGDAGAPRELGEIQAEPTTPAPASAAPAADPAVALLGSAPETIELPSKPQAEPVTSGFGDPGEADPASADAGPPPRTEAPEAEGPDQEPEGAPLPSPAPGSGDDDGGGEDAPIDEGQLNVLRSEIQKRAARFIPDRQAAAKEKLAALVLKKGGIEQLEELPVRFYERALQAVRNAKISFD